MPVIVTNPSTVVVVEDANDNIIISQTVNPVTILGGGAVTVVQQVTNIEVMPPNDIINVYGGIPGPQGPPGPGGGSDTWTVQSVSTAGTTTIATQTVQLMVLVDCTLGNIQINLPDCTAMSGLDIRIKRVDGSSHLITIMPFGGQTIDAFSSWTLYDVGECLQLNAQSEWEIV